MAIAIERLFEFKPDEFSVGQPHAGLIHPCFFEFVTKFSPESQAAWEWFAGDLTFGYKVDALARQNVSEQLWASIYDYPIRLITKTSRLEWLNVFMKLYSQLKAIVEDPQLFGSSFVSRKDYSKVDLREILRQEPQQIDVYVIVEERKYGKDRFLRMHTSVFSKREKAQRLWFEKQLPWRLHYEDVLPWFLATINRLPKKARPADLQPWLERLFQSEPDLACLDDGSSKLWSAKPKVVFNFGPKNQYGYRALFHFERHDINCVRRRAEVITIVGRTRIRFVGQPDFVENWNLHVITDNEIAASRIEREILTGDRTIFSMDSEIVGMAAHETKRNQIYVVNVSEAVLQRLCLTDGQSLKLTSPIREQRKSYEIMNIVNG